jgi:hypothetical protein
MTLRCDGTGSLLPLRPLKSGKMVLCLCIISEDELARLLFLAIETRRHVLVV